MIFAYYFRLVTSDLDPTLHYYLKILLNSFHLDNHHTVGFDLSFFQLPTPHRYSSDSLLSQFKRIL